MPRIFSDNPESIGNTPLIKLNRIVQGLHATILAKVEARNPTSSIKCRVGANLVMDAERRGALKQGMEIIEPTSGNTGIALAYTAAVRGYRITLTMPETMSIERRKLLSLFGANLVLTPGCEGMNGAIKVAEEMAASEPNRFFIPQQFKNPANPQIHEQTTGPEIWRDTDGRLDILVAGVGTGGTITGISRYIKQQAGSQILSVAVEPLESPVISQHLAGLPLKPGAHTIQGIGAGFIPDILDLSLIDRVEAISGDEAIHFARRLALEEGIPAGISSGAAVAAAVRVASDEVFTGKTIVVILPDSAERYLSSPLFDLR